MKHLIHFDQILEGAEKVWILCVETNNPTNWTVGKKYQLHTERGTFVRFKLKNDNKQFTYVCRGDDVFTFLNKQQSNSVYWNYWKLDDINSDTTDTAIFTYDDSVEEYKVKKTTRQFDL